ncbi:MAG: preprotein translocase subunit SecE [Bacteroidota bacterium]|nr:preprotein translocase subunit SecE [Bacteroidota bacterium]
MDKLVLYFKESYSELLDKVSWPTWPNLLDSAKVVIISSFIIAIIIFVMDFICNLVIHNGIYAL